MNTGNMTQNWKLPYKTLTTSPKIAFEPATGLLRVCFHAIPYVNMKA